MTEMNEHSWLPIDSPHERDFVAARVDSDGVYVVDVEWRADEEMFVSVDGRGFFPPGFFTHWRNKS